MELYRRLGIEELVREAGASLSPSKGIYSGASLKDIIEPKSRSGAIRNLPWAGCLTPLGPVSGTFVTQDMIEPVLVDVAQGRGVDVRFDTECVGVEQDEDSVTAVLKDRKTGAISTIRAHYLIAADGAESPIRTRLGVPTTGKGTLGYLLNILFHADLTSLVHGREFSLCKVERPEVTGLITSINNSDCWVFHLLFDPSKGEQPSDFPPEKCKELLHLALGIPDIEIDIKSILPWKPSVTRHTRCRHGGGQGANTGIADVHNLAWKLAAVLQGHATKSLLETYDIERISVGRAAAEFSASLADEDGIISTKGSFTLPLVLLKGFRLLSGHGYCYASKAICAEDTSPLGGLTWRPWTLPSLALSIDGRPGSRIPHLWVEHQGKRVSTLDLCGKNFLLLAGADGTSWVEAANGVSSAMGIDIAAFCAGPEGGLVSPKGKLETAAGISSRGAILVRPDDFVAWRQRRQVSDPEAELTQAVRRALCLP
ncbi:uncharacterized protein A1O5_01846 [Cladophialophora psammophila CBS 110553]|uniref:FAD-binding domain-containing protein n=1 Tax=Cladophialophora psammophila CBS 110553 TaxID=1182543 RepID=W9XCV1_9EURO|nr:uncharacterized protein A1O5_01846 [Cladophialophora psammophila CBS 110553]EXJ75150.1 hypothetical protein A1O5_01846 [Cladophialophora psammophila CBS 110553]